MTVIYFFLKKRQGRCYFCPANNLHHNSKITHQSRVLCVSTHLIGSIVRYIPRRKKPSANLLFLKFAFSLSLSVSPANEICEGNVFSGVCLSMGGMHGRGACMARGCALQGVCMVGGVHGKGACTAGETATAAGDTHPTEMYSCFIGMITEWTLS